MIDFLIVVYHMFVTCSSHDNEYTLYHTQREKGGKRNEIITDGYVIVTSLSG